MRKFLFFFLLNPLFCFTQSLYNQYLLYEPLGKMYDLDSLRTIEINFYDSNFNNVLDSTYFNDPLYRLPAQITFNNITLDKLKSIK